MRYLTPPPMPSEKVLNAASVPRAITRPFHRSRSVSPAARCIRPPRDREDAAPEYDRDAASALRGTSGPGDPRGGAPLVVQVVHQATRETPQQAVERIPHRQTDQQLEEQAGQQPAPVVQRFERPVARRRDAAARSRSGVAEKKPRGCLGWTSRTVTSDSRKNATMPARGTSSRMHQPKLCCFIQLTL